MRMTTMRGARGTGLALAAALVLAAPTAARAGDQTFGLGVRMSMVRGGSSATGAAADRFSGGLVRLRPSPHLAIEVAIDYRSSLNDDLTERIKDMPIQASLLLYPFRTAVAPYLLGGVGWYGQTVSTVADGQDLSSTTTRTFGSHAGFGGEVRLGAHAAVHADYRYTFIHLGSDGASQAKAGGLSIPIISSLQQRLQVSHNGSMWTAGMTLYF